MPEPIDWVEMTFDPKLRIDPHYMIRVMRGEVATLTKDQWEDAKECCADMLEQFVAMRKERG
jgi:hypothetical protein